MLFDPSIPSHEARHNPALNDAQQMRHADPVLLARALMATRSESLQLHAAIQVLAGDTPMPIDTQLNPWLWELGHIGWFEEWWIARNTQRERGIVCDPLAERRPSLLPRADTMYDSSHVPHDTRWALPLPSFYDTLQYLAAVREQTLSRLMQASHDDDSLYFYRLVLFHEDMHREALLYMAHALDIPLHEEIPGFSHILSPDTTDCPNNISATTQLSSRVYELGSQAQGFAFDNELHCSAQQVAAFEVDASPVSWARYLPFLEQGGYAQKRWWSAAGWQWLQAQPHQAPRYVRRTAQGWEQKQFAQWQPLHQQAAASHLTHYEAEAWCRWAGRRLPTELEWEYAASHAPNFHWGEVWEWTASAFAPYPGFTTHPYRDYSAPWFADGRPVLRGGSRFTAPRMKHAKYRNYFTAERNDVMAGFRSCAM